MSNLQSLGTFSRRDAAIDVRFERYYPHAIEKVWRALTDPERLADWMGASRVEPRVGGRIEMMLGGPAPMHGTVLEWEPPNVLEFTWSNRNSPDGVVRYELERQGTGTRLVFSHQGMPYASSLMMLPGWHVLFASLGRALDGATTTGPSWREMQDVYAAHYALNDVKRDH